MRHRLNTEELDGLKEVASNCLCFNTRKAARTVTRFYDRYFAGARIGPMQFNLLVAIRLSEPVPIVRLAEHLALERTTFTRNLGLLQRDGLVEIERGKDARKRLLSLTPAGRTALKEALPYWEQAQRAAVSALGRDDFRRLNEALSQSTTALNLEE